MNTGTAAAAESASLTPLHSLDEARKKKAPAKKKSTKASKAKGAKPLKASKAKAKKDVDVSQVPKRKKEVDPGQLDADVRTKNLSRIYKLEKNLENKKALLDSASHARRAARADYEEALNELQKEINEQRYGPGPLFNEDGSGPAGAPQNFLPDDRDFDDDDPDSDDGI